MRPSTLCQRLFIWFALAALWIANPGLAPYAMGQETEKSSSLGKALEASMTWQKFYPDGGKTEPIEARQVMKFSNPTRKKMEDDAVAGILLLQVQSGLPIAFVNIYPYAGKILHEMDVASRSAKFVASYDSGEQWRPKSTGLKFLPLQTDQPPADSPAIRLRQMKEIARKFTCTLTGWEENNSDRQTLRLLPKELYRYEVEQDVDEGETMDGAIFTFAQGNDPEVFLLIECTRQGDQRSWEYAFVRATSGGLEAALGSSVVWEAAKYPRSNDPSLPHYTYERSLP